MGDIILTMKGIDKSFPGVHALDHVDLEVRKGEVLALMGENGAGKSTLMKVLAGSNPDYTGEVLYNGNVVELRNPAAAKITANSPVAGRWEVPINRALNKSCLEEHSYRARRGNR